MKKIIIILWSIILSVNTLAYEFRNGREYIKKNKVVHNVPSIIEFFSFFCPYCYEFEKVHNRQNLIKKKLTQNIQIKKYHVNFLGGKLSLILTKSWIIAQQMGVEEKIILPIFKGIQETHTIHNINNIKKIFKKEAGISENKFDNFWNSLTLNILLKKINLDIKKSDLDHIPVMLINGKYIVDYAKLETIFQENFSKKYIALINFLINKK
ncbi:thiol:disulfide interchange protein [Buchnera aphidicola (Macrosiphoniella sanborni)]|uniref:Thiol:disulfide interchange protein n=1 Tax=Buchnera aphidicola (Macrosiphoniella sanborni) TaxID=1241865 RepID=A0A4D6Y4C8_9GAMM|nr:DsbA family protein [Buchnera aphidicola]QCI23949.1 thiol:disulfide interchange protein [Buchnera aphidicola (Macrosiphoniella sanborni)]